MKALKDCSWIVRIKCYGEWYFEARTKDDFGICMMSILNGEGSFNVLSGNKFSNKEEALANWVEFARLHNITNFSIEE